MVCTGKPQLPEAVSIIYSPRCGLSIFTHISMTWRGVKYCPFSPLADLLTRYSKASSTTSRLELNSFTSCKPETQTARWLSESSNLASGGNTPGHCRTARANRSSSLRFRSLVCPLLRNSRGRKPASSTLPTAACTAA